MAGMSGGSMLRTRRKDANVKPNRRLDRKSSRGMLFENEELRLRTININAEVERGQSDIKKLKRENEQLRREVGTLRGEYDRLERLLHQRQNQESPEPDNHEEDKISIKSCCSDCSIDCCKIRDSFHPEIIICDSSDVMNCPMFPACHSMEMLNKEDTTKEKYSKFKNNDTCQKGEDTKKTQHGEKCQKNQMYDDCRDCTTSSENKRYTESRQNTIDSHFKMEHDDRISNDRHKIKKSSSDSFVECRKGTSESDRKKNRLDEISLASSCGQLCSTLKNAHDDETAKGCLKLPVCKKLDFGLSRCFGTLLSPVPEENGVPRGPLSFLENEEGCTCPKQFQEAMQDNSMDNSEPEVSQNKEYYKAVVTVPLFSHIPNESNNVTSDMPHKSTDHLEESISVFPKTGLDILINNNCYEQFEGFSSMHPLGFIVPPPLNQDMKNSDEPFQIVPNVEFTNPNFSYLDSRQNVPNLDNLCSNYEQKLTLNSNTCSNSPLNTIPFPPKSIPSSFNNDHVSSSHSYGTCIMNPNDNLPTTSGLNGQFLVTSCSNIIQPNNANQTHTIMTSNGLIFTSNYPIMSSVETTKIPPVICPSNDAIPNNNLTIVPDCLQDLDPILQEHEEFRRNFQGCVGNSSSSTCDSSDFKDSFFVCKTRKVIQQLTTIHNSNLNNLTSPCGCTCKCNQQNQEVSRETVSSVCDRNSKNTSFKTEKSIELNYDYPRPHNEGINEDTNRYTNEIPVEPNDRDTTQTIHTTTEVNSTLYLFERKKLPIKMRNKSLNYMRSNSAPVEIPSDEPIYATVNKLPKKLRRLNIKNLENEIKYVLPDEIDKDAEITKDESKEDITGAECSDEIKKDKSEMKINGVANTIVTKIDSFSESSDKNTGIPKSPCMVRKKKKFSIRFKRKYSKSNKLNVEYKASNGDRVDNTKTGSDKLELNLPNHNSESDKLIDASSSLDSPDIKNLTNQQNFCKIHGKPKHSHQHHYRTGCESPRCYRTEYTQHRCGTLYKQTDAGVTKKHLQTTRSYLKQDSYQEITTSHSERERTNSLSSSGHSGFSLGSKARSSSHSRREGSIPWCGCWGNSCV